MRRILLLGKSGFIGKNLYEYLTGSDGEYVIDAPGRAELNILDEDSVKEYLSVNSYDVVIHAAICNPVRESVIITNELEQDLRGFYNFAKYHYLYGKMLYFGSGAEYDKSRNISCVTEMDVNHSIPKTNYGLAKYIIGKSIECSDNIYNLRVFGLFGKYENWRTTFISGACCKALKGFPITIRQNVYFDYMYIDDFCKIVEWFIKNEAKHHTYNMSSGKRIDLVSIARIINSLVGNAVPIYVCKDGLGNEYTASNARLRKEYVTVSQEMKYSIAALLEYYQGILDKIDTYSLLYQ